MQAAIPFLVLGFFIVVLIGIGSDIQRKKDAKRPSIKIDPEMIVNVEGKLMKVKDAIKAGAVIVYEPPKPVEKPRTDFLGRPIKK